MGGNNEEGATTVAAVVMADSWEDEEFDLPSTAPPTAVPVSWEDEVRPPTRDKHCNHTHVHAGSTERYVEGRLLTVYQVSYHTYDM